MENKKAKATGDVFLGLEQDAMKRGKIRAIGSRLCFGYLDA